jgi:NAD(P)H-hydrate epimerase
VLTPHPGELARLLDCKTEDVVSDRVAAARDVAARSESVVVAKGYRTVIAEPDGEVFINPPGNAGLASGGSGDILTGVIAAFLAQGLEPARAAIVGCWLHGRAGELGEEQWCAAVPASELPRFVAAAWRELEDR